MEPASGYLLAGVALCWMAVLLAAKRRYAWYAWLVVLLFVGAYVWLFLGYLRLNSLHSLVAAIDNMTFFLGPVVSIMAALVVLLDSRKRSRASGIFEEDVGIMLLVPYQVFFFLVAYPHTKYTHLSWSYPSTMILLLFLLERARKWFVSVSLGSARKAIGRVVGTPIFFALPVLILLAKIFWLLGPFVSVSPDLREWTRKSFVKLNNERAGIYEATASAIQIEAVDRFVQTNTEKGDFLFEFPTTFFYYYSQRTNPSKWDYFYPGLYSSRQDEIIDDLEKARPTFALVFDNPRGWLFSYSNPEMQEAYGRLIRYLDTHYEADRRIGNFRILKRKSSR
jgi:hypothetical protein